jgi:hypothetical protein
VEILPREIKKNTEEIFKVRIPIIKIKLLTMLLKLKILIILLKMLKIIILIKIIQIIRKKKYWYSKSIKISIKLKFLKIP